jgi:hypothetical protein
MWSRNKKEKTQYNNDGAEQIFQVVSTFDVTQTRNK